MILGIIQARTGATRFPQKVLRKINGKTLLELYIRRVQQCTLVDTLVVATTMKSEDNAVARIAEHCRCAHFRGSEDDLLDRFYQCAKNYAPEGVVRFTADNPFVDYQVVDRAIQLFKDTHVDLVTNHFEPTYPEGLDIEVYAMAALERSWQEARLLSEREHVFPYIQNHQDRFRVINFKQEKDYSHLRWTLDYECDFEMVKRVYNCLYEAKPLFLQEDILRVFAEHPEIPQLNAHIPRKEGVNKTKTHDKIVR